MIPLKIASTCAVVDATDREGWGGREPTVRRRDSNRREQRGALEATKAREVERDQLFIALISKFATVLCA